MSATVSSGDEVEFLMDDGDAGRFGLAHVGKRSEVAIDANLTVVARIDAGEDLHQRRLAGAVLAHQGVNFAAPQFEPDIRQGRDAAEAFADIARLKQRNGIARRCALMDVNHGLPSMSPTMSRR